MSLQPKSILSFDAWLEGERAALDERSEYVDGEVFAMSGGSAERNLIISNIAGELRTQFKQRPCRVYASGMKLRIQATDAGKYPDLMAICGEQLFEDGRRDLLLNPSLIVEVLSDSIEAYDRGDKFALYRRVPSLREYLLVSQHRVQCDLYTRGEDGHWILTSVDSIDAHLNLPSIDCVLALAEVYDKVEIATEAQSRG